jgi:cytochrome b561
MTDTLFQPKTYSAPAIFFHWLVALLIFVTVPLAWVMTDMATSPQKLQFYSWHKWIGVTVFLLAALRLLWRWSHGAPPAHAGMPDWQRKTAALTHFGLYVLLFALPVSGWVMSSAGGFPVVYLGIWQLPDLVAKNKPLFETMKEVHELLAYGLLGVVALHTLAALKHHFIDRDSVLVRMLPFLRPR